MVDVKKCLQLLFDRPGELLSTPKGENKAFFKLTEQFQSKEYPNVEETMSNSFGVEDSVKIELVPLSSVPQFPLASKLPKDADFTLFLSLHQDMASEVIDVLMGVPEKEEEILLSTCAYARCHLNSQLFIYCFSVALMHRKDTRDLSIANFAETFPSKFLDPEVFSQARELAYVVPEDVPREPIIIPLDYTASNLEIEHRLAYFREDVGINLHHWHWHLVYPGSVSNPSLISIVAKDRRGELFYYMHQQIIARYNCERLCNSLSRVKKFSNWRESIPEAYFPKLNSLTSARTYQPRQANMRWQDINRPVDGLVVTLEQMDTWRRNMDEAISLGLVTLPDGSTKPLDIDMLGNMMEASMLSPNKDLYGNIHNNGHSFIGYIHDPQHRHLESFGVMADESTTMRDPFFYRWHAWVDDTFQRHKESEHVPRYKRTELDNPGVQVLSASIQSSSTDEKNLLETFWMRSDVDLSRGLDFSDRGPVYVRFTHLNHRPFSYRIDVNNKGAARRCTVRIFIAPKFDERGLPWTLIEQRRLFIEMDRFVKPLTSGQNTIIRQSNDSSVTIPFEQTFRDLSAQGSDPRAPALTAFNFCGCGWPQHMLVPKGTEIGAPYQLFVMLSNYDLDKVDQPDGTELTCKEASSYCGLKNRLYPDKRAMGFPFDRPSDSAASIKDFILPNMALTDITIKLQNVTEDNPKNLVK